MTSKIISFVAIGLIFSSVADATAFKCSYIGYAYGPHDNLKVDLGTVSEDITIIDGNGPLAGTMIRSPDGTRDTSVSVRDNSINFCQYNFHVGLSTFDACFSAPYVARAKDYTGNYDYVIDRQQILDGSYGSAKSTDGKTEVPITQIALSCSFFNQ